MPLSATSLPYPHPGLGGSCPQARAAHQPTLIKTPLMRWTKYLTSSQPARATSTNCPILHAHPHPIPHLRPTVACFPVSGWCCHGNGRIEVSILLLPAWLILFPAVCVCAVWLNTCLVPPMYSCVCAASSPVLFITLWTRL